MRKCPKCNKVWHYDIDRCIFCGSSLMDFRSDKLKVKGLTKVFVPSLDHKEVPYFVLLLEDKDGHHFIRKSKVEYKIGDEFLDGDVKQEKSFTVAVVGAGQMGRGLAEVCLKSGHKVLLTRKNLGLLRQAREDIEKALLKEMANDELARVIDRLKLITDLKDLASADIIVEAVSESLDVKEVILKDIEMNCSPNVIIATNTSSLSINSLASFISKKDRFIGLHFFNPVSRMLLVEIIRGNETSKETEGQAMEFVRSLGKMEVMVKDSAGFIVNRVLMGFLNEAVNIYDKGLSDADDIDKAVKLGLNHPIGPLALLDLIGIDVFYEIMRNLYKETGDKKYITSPIIADMVKRERFGRKSGEGFFKY